jgi:hypothetical protein
LDGDTVGDYSVGNKIINACRGRPACLPLSDKIKEKESRKESRKNEERNQERRVQNPTTGSVRDCFGTRDCGPCFGKDVGNDYAGRLDGLDRGSGYGRNFHVDVLIRNIG